MCWMGRWGEHRHNRSARSRPLVKITNLRAERARRDDPQMISVAAPYVWSGSRPCSAEYYTHFNCTFPARWLERPLPATPAVTCQPQLPSARYPSIIRCPIPGTYFDFPALRRWLLLAFESSQRSAASCGHSLAPGRAPGKFGPEHE